MPALPGICSPTARQCSCANYGKYVASESVATTTANNPVNTRINSATRTWLDTNGNFIPDCDLTQTGVTGECLALSAPLGNPNIVTTWDPNVLRGWNVRPDDGELLVGVQHQLNERLMVDVQWTRHWFGNFFATQYRADAAGRLRQFLHHNPVGFPTA